MRERSLDIIIPDDHVYHNARVALQGGDDLLQRIHADVTKKDNRQPKMYHEMNRTESVSALR